MNLCINNIRNYNFTGCETWSFTLTEEHRLRVSENRVLRRIFGSKREGGCGRTLEKTE